MPLFLLVTSVWHNRSLKPVGNSAFLCESRVRIVERKTKMSNRCTLFLVVTIACSFGVFEASVSAQPEHLSLDGRWVVGEMGDQPRWELTVSGTTGTASEFDLAHVRTIVITEQGEPSHYLVTSPSRPDTRHFLVVGEAHALTWEDGDDDLSYAYRLDPTPEAVQGEWTMYIDGEFGHAAIDGNSMLIELGGAPGMGRAVGAEIYGTASTDNSIGVVVFIEGEEVQPLRFIPVEEGVLLAYVEGEGEYVLFYRPDSPPSWLGSAALPPGSGGTPPPTP